MKQALAGARIVTRKAILLDHALIVEDGKISAIMPADKIPSDVKIDDLDAGYLAPGFIDLQVNGGGGVLFNDAPSVEAITAIAMAHRRFGTTSLLPTLISDDLSVVEAALRAVEEAVSKEVPGIVGIHLEGPFLNTEKKGIHDPSKFVELDDEAIDLITSTNAGKILITLAPEMVEPGKIRRLVDAGIIVAAGHTNASYESIHKAYGEGLSGFTHLYNAMSPLESRAPGVVGAALEASNAWCGIIADGYHVHAAAMRIALKCKSAEQIVLVTDAMPTVGSSEKTFQYRGETLEAKAGKITDKIGRLAGSDLDMMAAIKNAHELFNTPLTDAIAMATSSPANAIGLQSAIGKVAPNYEANLVHFSDEFTVKQTWISGLSEYT